MKTQQSDLILKYVYEETSVDESQIVEELLYNDSDMMDLWLELVEVKELTESFEVKVSDKCTNKILQASKALEKKPFVL